MYSYRGVKSSEKVLRGHKNTPAKYGRGYKPDNSLSNMALEYRRGVANNLVDNKKKMSLIL